MGHECFAVAVVGREGGGEAVEKRWRSGGEAKEAVESGAADQAYSLSQEEERA